MVEPWFLTMYMHTCVPWWMLVVICMITGVMLVMRWTWRWRILLVAYMVLVVCQVLVFREPGKGMHAILLPFWNYYDVFVNGNLEDMGEIIMNVLLFVPIGVASLPARTYSDVLNIGLRRESAASARTEGSLFWKAVAMGAAFSIGIELLQLVSHRGLCETDDVIHNTLGVIIGWGTARGARSMILTQSRPT